MIKSDVITNEIDAVVHKNTFKRKVCPILLHYKDFPKNCYTSFNELASHRIPSNFILVKVDIVSINVTLYRKLPNRGCLETFHVGEVDERGRKLATVAHDCLELAIAAYGPDFPVKSLEV